MMGVTDRSGIPARHPVFAAIADRRRRHVVALLMGRGSPASVDDLAVDLAATDQAVSVLRLTDGEVRSVRRELVHAKLPRLVDAGLVAWRWTAETVATTDHPVYDDPTFERLVRTDGDDWDDVLANLAYRRRRIALSVLDDGVRRSVTDLARDVAARETGSGSEFTCRGIEGLRAALHHVHLPKLSAAGLVSYDPSRGTVSYEGHPELDDSWLDCRSGGTPTILLAAEQFWEPVSDVGRDGTTGRGRALGN